MGDFINAVFRPAVHSVSRYLDITHSLTDDPEYHLFRTVMRVPADHISPCWTDDDLIRHIGIAGDAEQAIDTPEIRERVLTNRLPVQYLRLRRMPDGRKLDRVVKLFAEHTQHQRIEIAQ